MDFGVRLRATRKEARLSQPALAEQAKVDKGTINRWETGRQKKPDPGGLAAVAHVLGVRPEWLLSGALPKAPERQAPLIEGVPYALPQLKALLEGALSRLGELEVDVYAMARQIAGQAVRGETGVTTPTPTAAGEEPSRVSEKFVEIQKEVPAPDAKAPRKGRKRRA